MEIWSVGVHPFSDIAKTRSWHAHTQCRPGPIKGQENMALSLQRPGQLLCPNRFLFDECWAQLEPIKRDTTGRVEATLTK